MKTTIGIVLALVLANDVLAGSFNPFKWREAGVNATEDLSERKGKQRAFQFSYDGVEWRAYTSDRSSERGQETILVYGHVGEWGIGLDWLGWLGEPTARAFTKSRPEDAETRLTLDYRCSGVDPDLSLGTSGRTGWKVDIRWNTARHGRGPSDEEDRQFRHTRGMAGGYYGLRVDDGAIRKVEMVGETPSRYGPNPWLDTAYVKENKDNMWLDSKIPAGRRVDLLAREWIRFNRKEEWQRTLRTAWFSLAGSRKALEIAKVHCERPPRPVE